jgi:hypothetical protein
VEDADQPPLVTQACEAGHASVPARTGGGIALGLGIASLAFGVLAMPFALLPCFGSVGLPLGMVGLVLGVAGGIFALRSGRWIGISIGGAATSGVALLIVVVWMQITAAFENVFSGKPNSEPSMQAAEAEKVHQPPDPEEEARQKAERERRERERAEQEKKWQAEREQKAREREEERKREEWVDWHIRQLDSRVVAEQVAAIRELGRWRGKKVVRALVRAFTAYNSRNEDDDPTIPQAAAAAVRGMGVDAVPDLVDMLNDSWEEHRFSAATALENLLQVQQLPESAIPGLRRALHDDLTRSTAAGLLARVVPGDPELMRYLIGVLQGDEDKGDEREDARSRIIACNQLGSMGPKAREAIPALREALRHPGVLAVPRDSVRNAAARALAKIQR